MDRVVFVTGANRGIGRAIAERFRDDGDRVIAATRSGEAPEGCTGVVCDVTDTASVEAAFAEAEQTAGPVEVLVANAGITRDGLLLRMPDEDIDAVLQTNLVGALRVARRAARGMLRARRGRIVLISSVVWALGSAGQVNYAAAKAGLVGAGRSMARELGSRGITVNVVAPGFVATDMTAVLPAERQQEIVSSVPLGRLAAAEDVAEVVRFLASPEAAYVTGAVVPVDGGLGMGH